MSCHGCYSCSNLLVSINLKFLGFSSPESYYRQKFSCHALPTMVDVSNRLRLPCIYHNRVDRLTCSMCESYKEGYCSFRRQGLDSPKDNGFHPEADCPACDKLKLIKEPK